VPAPGHSRNVGRPGRKAWRQRHRPKRHNGVLFGDRSPERIIRWRPVRTACCFRLPMRARYGIAADKAHERRCEADLHRPRDRFTRAGSHSMRSDSHFPTLEKWLTRNFDCISSLTSSRPFLALSSLSNSASIIRLGTERLPVLLALLSLNDSFCCSFLRIDSTRNAFTCSTGDSRHRISVP
jgi:hypothetical protein